MNNLTALALSVISVVAVTNNSQAQIFDIDSAITSTQEVGTNFNQNIRKSSVYKLNEKWLETYMDFTVSSHLGAPTTYRVEAKCSAWPKTMTVLGPNGPVVVNLPEWRDAGGGPLIHPGDGSSDPVFADAAATIDTGKVASVTFEFRLRIITGPKAGDITDLGTFEFTRKPPVIVPPPVKGIEPHLER